MASTTTSNKFKILLLGDSDVGKTSIIHRYINNDFQERYKSPLLGELTKRVLVNNEEMILEIWDTAGQERYKSIETCFYRESDAIILVYDVTNPDSFHSICDSWIKETQRHRPEGDGQRPVMITAGNKHDLLIDGEYDEDGIVPIDKVKDFSQSYDLLNPVMTSAKTGHNVQHVFHLIATELYKRQVRQQPITTNNVGSGGCCYGGNNDRATANASVYVKN